MKKFGSHYMALYLAVLGISACTENSETSAATAAAANVAQLPVLIRQGVQFGREALATGGQYRTSAPQRKALL